MRTKFLFAICFLTIGIKAQVTTLLNFNDTNGANPQGSLIYDGTYLYGAAPSGGIGTDHYGLLYKIKPDGSGYDSLFNFNATNGASPVGSLIYDSTYLYGMTHGGGANFYGTIFKIKPDGTGHTILYSFNGSSGAYPWGSLVTDGTYFYGMTSAYGAIGYNGTLFKIKKDGTGYVKLLDFNGSGNGGKPTGSLIFDGT